MNSDYYWSFVKMMIHLNYYSGLTMILSYYLIHWTNLTENWMIVMTSLIHYYWSFVKMMIGYWSLTGLMSLTGLVHLILEKN
jgi:hypothetical protein